MNAPPRGNYWAPDYPSARAVSAAVAAVVERSMSAVSRRAISLPVLLLSAYVAVSLFFVSPSSSCSGGRAIGFFVLGDTIENNGTSDGQKKHSSPSTVPASFSLKRFSTFSPPPDASASSFLSSSLSSELPPTPGTSSLSSSSLHPSVSSPSSLQQHAQKDDLDAPEALDVSDTQQLEGFGEVAEEVKEEPPSSLSLPSIVPRLAVATVGSLTELSTYLLLLAGSPASASSSFLSSFSQQLDATSARYHEHLSASLAGGGDSPLSQTTAAASGSPTDQSVDRNIMVSYRNFRASQPFEMFSRRNSFIRMLIGHLLDLLSVVSRHNLTGIRTVYLRNIGMEIFQLPRELDFVLDVADFWRVLAGFPDYVEGIFQDQELDGFDDVVAKPEEVPPDGNRSTNTMTDEEPKGGHASTFSTERQEAEVTGSSSRNGNRNNSNDAEADGRRNSRPLRSLQSTPPLPNDPYYATQWAHRDSGAARWGIETPEAWKYWRGETREKILVALIDSGVDYRHPDLRSNIWVNEKEVCGNGADDDNNGLVDDCYGWDFFNGDNDPMDDNGHGTASAGIIAGESNNGLGISGVCWGGCSLLVIKALNHQIKGTVIGFVRAIDYAIGQGAKVSNNSYGGRGSRFAGLQEAVKRAQDTGMIFVAAAGNYKGNNDNDSNPVYPASYKLDNVVSVAAVTRAGELADFSSYGRTSVDLAAPGQDIFSTTTGGGYKSVDGTSFAVPFVSGAAALIWSREPSLPYTTVIRRLKQFTKYDPKLSGKLRSSGVLNVYAAMTENGKVLQVHPSQSLLPPPAQSTNRAGWTCASQPSLCGDNADCVDEEHSGPRCVCKRGFQRNGDKCEDTDECLYNPCGPAATCKNLPGSFECSCREGFIQVGDSCQDINECASRGRLCPPQAKCINHVGNFDCRCPPNSAWNAQKPPASKCLTIHSPPSGPCVRNGDCQANSLCQSVGSWWFPEKKCVCLAGYVQHPTSSECVRPGVIMQ